MYDYDFRGRTARVLLQDKGSTWEVSGSYPELKNALSALKSQGWRWNPGARVWSISKSKLTPRKLSNIKKKLGIRDDAKERGPDLEGYAELERALKPYISGKFPKGFVLPPMGIDLRSYGVDWGSSARAAGWFVTPESDVQGLLKDLSTIVRAYESIKSTAKRLSKLPSDDQLNVSVSNTTLYLKGKATYHIKDDLKRLGFRYDRSAGWSISAHKVKSVSQLEHLLSKARELAAPKPQERRGPSVSAPATDKQKAFLRRLTRRHHSDWFDVTDGIGGTRPPSDAQIENMDAQTAKMFIDLALDWERSFR